MSIYNPPSKTQGIFNLSNYGTLGSNGEITKDYLDANYLSFPIAQGNTTLVGTSVFGNISQQQGTFTTTGNITGASIEGTSFLVGETNLVTEIGNKQDTIEDGDLAIAKTGGLQSALDDKQDTIEDGDLAIAKTGGLQSALDDKQDEIADGNLTIAKTDGLQSALDDKQDTIEDGNLTIAKTNGLQSALDDKQDTIEDGDLTIAKTNGLQSALDNKYDDTGGTISGSVSITGDLVVGATNIITEIGTKQDEITTDTDLISNSITTDDLIINESLNVDNNIISYDSKKFNTIVVRRPSGIPGNTTMSISLIEFQVWVNSVNILPTNVSSTYFSLWTNKDEDIGHYAVEAPERIYDEIISDGSVSNSFGADNNSQEVALVINLNSLINVLDLQSLVLYNRVSSQARKDKAIGLVVVHLSDHNPVMVAQVDYHIRAEQSINGKETSEYILKVSMI